MGATSEPSLPKNVADKYDLRIIQPATYHIPGIGNVDFTTIDLKTAARVAKKTPYLVTKETAPATKTKPAAV